MTRSLTRLAAKTGSAGTLSTPPSTRPLLPAALPTRRSPVSSPERIYLYSPELGTNSPVYCTSTILSPSVAPSSDQLSLRLQAEICQRFNPQHHFRSAECASARWLYSSEFYSTSFFFCARELNSLSLRQTIQLAQRSIQRVLDEDDNTSALLSLHASATDYASMTGIQQSSGRPIASSG